MRSLLRITKAKSSPAVAGSYDEYLGRLLKLIPSEVVGLYLIGTGIIKENELRTGIWAGICFVLVIIVRYLTTKDPASGKSQWLAIFISSLAFVVWVYSLAGLKILMPYEAEIGSLGVLLVSFIVPLIYKGE